MLFIPAKYTKKIAIPKNIIDKLPKRLMLFSSVQFLNQLQDIEKQLKDKKITTTKSKNFLYNGMISEKGQLLGCNMEAFTSDFDAFLYIGDGIFHPKALLVNNHKDVYCYDPKINKLHILKKELHEDMQKRSKGAVLKFLTGKSIGILVTTKPGQDSSKRAEILKNNIEKRWPEKKRFMFLCNELNFQELENFNFIDLYINTACPRLGHDDTARSPKPIINMEDIESLLK
jgi:2-(3-amino-3-carboxypropyl)histidine synthase